MIILKDVIQDITGNLLTMHRKEDNHDAEKFGNERFNG